MRRMTSSPQNISPIRIVGTLVVVLLGSLLASSFFQTCLSSKRLSANFISPTTWLAITKPAVDPSMGMPETVPVPFWRIAVPSGIVSLMAWLAGAALLVFRKKMNWLDALVAWGWYGWWWWWLIDLWEWSWIASGLMQWSTISAVLSVTPQFWLAGCLSCWLTTWLILADRQDTIALTEPRRISVSRIWIACGLYILIFTTLNWRLYFNLLVPHGDSVMYEEHLWNILHGKGFRSYLDRGLFLGEHIQFVHLFLLPLYLIWPSHLLLEACSSTALACGAFPVFWMTRRATRSDQAAFAAAIAYLLYAPMQFLDIEIDLKTFRPESFGIPLLLLTLDQLDRRHLIGTVIGIAGCLTVKEDYCVIFGPLGLWIALTRPAMADQTDATQSATAAHSSALSSRRFRVMFGLGLSVFSVVYLWLATRVVMPWFRSGAEVHYASYFSKFGKTPEEILQTMATHPGTFLAAFLTPEMLLYAIAMLAPIAFIPLFAPFRLLVGLPLFCILCLNELEGSRTPQHQFHAPLVAIVFWSLAAGLPNAAWLFDAMLRKAGKAASRRDFNLIVLRNLIWTSALTTGLFFSLGPLGVPFWDPGSSWYWRQLYGPNPRAARFARIATLIPTTTRVASTDFVHPRYTHHQRSYDYSNYQRQVSGEGKRIPDDTDYIVIDTNHKYSQIKRPEEIPELRDHPERWELLPDTTEGYFIVLKRKQDAPEQNEGGR